MSEEPVEIEQSKQDITGSYLFGVSVRSWIALMVTFTVCLISGYIIWILAQEPDEKLEIKEPLYGIVYLVLGYIFSKANTLTKT